MRSHRISGWQLPTVLSTLVGAILFVSPLRARADVEEEEGGAFLFNIAASVGGAYTSNLYQNASQAEDLNLVGNLAMDLDILPSSAWILEASYRGDIDAYNRYTDELHFGNNLSLVAGYRPLDTVYLSLHAGGEQTYYPDRREYNLWSIFGGVGWRWEAGESSTLKARYRFRADLFPEYDLDNTSHTGELRYEIVIDDYLELAVPFTYRARLYSERFLQNSDGTPSAVPRFGHNLQLVPKITYQPFFDLSLDATVRGELNYTEDTYYYAGPFGVADPAVDPALISHFDSYWAVGGGLRALWELHDSVTVALRFDGGTRQYLSRPAFDDDGLNRGELQVDVWLQPGLELEWRVAGAFGITARYHYLKQMSNDALWDYDDHQVSLELGTWWEN